MADWGVRLSKLAQFLATGGTVPETAISTAEMDTALVLHPDGGGGVEWDTDATGGGGGLAVGQVVDYPTTFTGDTIDGSSTTPFVDVAAFDVKEVLNSRVLHLVTLGASKDDRVRVTLGTTKAAAFDVRVCLRTYFHNWTTAIRDHWVEVRLSDASDVQLAAFRFRNRSFVSNGDNMWVHEVVHAIGTGAPPTTGILNPFAFPGETVTLRFTRDGSDNVLAYHGKGTAPLALMPAFSDVFVPTTAVVSGTLARIEIAHHTPAGPGATSEAIHTWVDYVQSV